MSRHLGARSAVGILSLFVVSTALADEGLVANPYYTFWAGSRPGATAVHLEQTKLSGPEGKLVPGGVDEKRIVYKLVEVNKDRAVISQVVTERDFLGWVEAAPTRHIYPAKLEKSRLDRILLENGGKGREEETMEVGGKNVKTRTVTGSIKGPDGEQIDFKLWLSDDVPGTIVKQVRTARQKGDVIAETTTTLESYEKPSRRSAPAGSRRREQRGQ
jgi:hypothetical protein